MQLFDLLRQKSLSPSTSDIVALAHKSRGNWKKYTYSEYFDISQKLSWAFLSRNIGKGDNVGSMISSNRAEWNFLDMALLQIGAVHVSLFPTFDPKDLMKMLNESELKYLFVGNKAIAKTIKALFPKLSFLRDIICFDETEGEFCHWEEWIDNIVLSNDQKNKLTELSQQVGPTDMVAILYTSGTGGNPNGVIYYNRQMLHMFEFFTPDMLEISQGEKVLSFLPLNHAYERYHTYFYLNIGASVYYADSGTGLVENLTAVKPVAFNGVPLILEKLFDTIRSQIKELPEDEQPEALQAFDHTLSYDHCTSETYKNNPNTKYYREKHYKRWLTTLGGELRHVGSAGAKLPVIIARFFWGIGVPIFEVYGLTEAHCVTFTHPKVGAKFGSVGKAIPYNHVRISDEGEILCKGPCMMMGYYKNEALNKIVFDEEGWYHTKDLGVMDEHGFITISGRKNNFFKLSSGKFINPEEIEKMMLQSLLFANAMVTTNDLNQLVAILCVSHDANEHEIWIEIDKYYNHLVVEAERITKCLVVPNTWAPETGELTPLMKIKRNVIRQKYLEQIS